MRGVYLQDIKNFDQKGMVEDELIQNFSQKNNNFLIIFSEGELDNEML